MQARGITFKVVNTNLSPSFFKKSWSILKQLFTALPATDTVWLNVSGGGFRWLSPLLFLWTKLLGKKYVFRIFGGNFAKQYAGLSRTERWLQRNTSLQADLVLLQTKSLMDRFSPLCKKVAWLPTTRPGPDTPPDQDKAYSKKLVYIGRLRRDKGLPELKRLVVSLPPEYSLHIYGPAEDDYARQHILSLGNYQGALKPSQVTERLSQYDLLLLPTYYPGEGYPGIVIEAFSVGVPCLVTDWNDLNELVQDDYNGYLYRPRDAAALLAAVQRVDQKSYPRLRKNAFTSFQAFNEDQVLDKTISHTQSL